MNEIKQVKDVIKPSIPRQKGGLKVYDKAVLIKD